MTIFLREMSRGDESKMHIMYPQMIRMTDFSPTRRELLKEMALQAEVLDRISHLLLEKNNISASHSECKICFRNSENNIVYTAH